MKQSDTFIEGEGDQYFRRNGGKLEQICGEALSDPSSDPVIHVLNTLRPKSILDVGACTGWRLHVCRQLFGAMGIGIDPSADAVAYGRRAYDLDLKVGSASSLPATSVDCVVFGLVLCWVDRAELFRIVAEADRVLTDGGYIIIHDFYPSHPHCREYHHRDGLHTYKMDYSKLWTANPAYSLWSLDITAHRGASPVNLDERQAVMVLRKSMGDAFHSVP